MDAQRALLDSLMGAQRNHDMDELKRKSWKESDVCKHFLVSFCPYELFLGTKSDLGLCKKLHEEHLRHTYRNKAKSRTKAKYEKRFLDFLSDLISTLDHKIRRAEDRLNEKDEEPEEVLTADDVLTEQQKDRLKEIEKEIERKNEKMELCGNEGRVEEAQRLLGETENLQLEQKKLQEQAQVVLRSGTHERPLKTCEICGAFVDRVDPSRTLNHESGRTHQGFSLVRETAAELKQILKKREEEERERSSDETERKRSRRKRKKRRSRSTSSEGSGHHSEEERRRRRRRRSSDYV